MENCIDRNEALVPQETKTPVKMEIRIFAYKFLILECLMKIDLVVYKIIELE